MVTKEQKTELIKKFGGDEKNTGASEVQVALLTARINDLQNHFKANPKDHASNRGLLQMIGQRRRLLRYIKNSDINKYRQILVDLNLRK
ncbi:MAG: 30S ribosomal protein S15 [Sphaerochaetaceae bacterium]|jgi:small subunit ribosomal protein S15|nr:30S ribosomal protein S15 [Sphaerochaetaceae bacterium]MDD3163456.1 30S ribosomal protein S15 [Sphaerochaetaceae bacterium]MDD4006743.1 30S ribosomal protein S15 [Sphaerochaetaceae bacterium]MDD4397361.1 30S ribosomal protein S15 [Sphaerochaetaceae bacterium]